MQSGPRRGLSTRPSTARSTERHEQLISLRPMVRDRTTCHHHHKSATHCAAHLLVDNATKETIREHAVFKRAIRLAWQGRRTHLSAYDPLEPLARRSHRHTVPRAQVGEDVPGQLVHAQHLKGTRKWMSVCTSPTRVVGGGGGGGMAVGITTVSCSRMTWSCCHTGHHFRFLCISVYSPLPLRVPPMPIPGLSHDSPSSVPPYTDPHHFRVPPTAPFPLYLPKDFRKALTASLRRVG